MTIEKGDFMNWLKQKLKNEEGRWGYILAWVVGVPIPILLIVYLLRGCN